MAQIINETDALDHVCPYNNFAACRGRACMAWTWNDKPFDEACTDNLVETAEGPRPLGVPKSPDGEGWEAYGPSRPKGYHRSGKDKLPQAQEQWWRRPRVVQQGYCARGREMW